MPTSPDSPLTRQKVNLLTRELIQCGRDFHHRGWSLGTSSNYSVVLERDPLKLLMTGSGFDKGQLLPEQFVIVDEQAQLLSPGPLKPSAEALLHTELAKHGAGAVLHTHSVPATVLSEYFVRHGGLRITGYEMLKGLSGIQTHEAEAWIEIYPNTQDIASLAAEINQRLGDRSNPLRHGFLMAGHGLYTWGENIAAARRQVEVLEFLFEVVTQKRLLFGSF
ncbi:methylthioribulose 1-phosphate dehydratase [Prosthecobacter vanneervenii]|uniref:Methylthioribulose-1-phosphate dehydratase n=1 Tax=Prosthecobacter vanneervenii TaxID=48466 RepID=A0A7W8DJL0_9BACT|nr:methylthioribulose 1-phosphate dehydratase [Prosthecobacter vanneervenii]MBB5032150.1 methylthioribulose-1-phosphate dehydratase [Prosthecobacter vanneervenii]